MKAQWDDFLKVYIHFCHYFRFLVLFIDSFTKKEIDAKQRCQIGITLDWYSPPFSLYLSFPSLMRYCVFHAHTGKHLMQEMHSVFHGKCSIFSPSLRQPAASWISQGTKDTPWLTGKPHLSAQAYTNLTQC